MSARACTPVRADLSAYLDGDLDAARADAIRAHLDGCADCRTELVLLRRALDSLHRLPDLPPPAAILTGVRARLRPEPWYRRLFSGRPWPLGVPAGALATVLVIVGIALFQSRYPGIERRAAQDAVPESPAPAKSAKLAATPTAPPQVTAARGKTIAPPAAAVGEADAGDRDRAAPASPTTPTAADQLVALPGRPTLELKDEMPPPAQPAPFAPPEPPTAIAQDALREGSWQRENLAAAPPLPTGAVHPAPDRNRADVATSSEVARAIAPSRGLKKSVTAAERTGENSADVGWSRLAAEQGPAAAVVRAVQLLPLDGESVDDLAQALRREGAFDIAIVALEPQAVREAYARQRDQPGFHRAPARGWTLTASVPAGDGVRLIAALARRAALRILEQPPAPDAAKDPAAPLELRITVLR